jgi:hypothetical protein
MLRVVVDCHGRSSQRDTSAQHQQLSPPLASPAHGSCRRLCPAGKRVALLQYRLALPSETGSACPGSRPAAAHQGGQGESRHYVVMILASRETLIATTRQRKKHVCAGEGVGGDRLPSCPCRSTRHFLDQSRYRISGSLHVAHSTSIAINTNYHSTSTTIDINLQCHSAQTTFNIVSLHLFVYPVLCGANNVSAVALTLPRRLIYSSSSY